MKGKYTKAVIGLILSLIVGAVVAIKIQAFPFVYSAICLGIITFLLPNADD